MTVTFPTRPDTAPVARAAPCQLDPDLWAEAGDDPTLRHQCRVQCRRRAACARDALNTPGAAGIWAGIYLPPADEESPRHDLSRAQAYARHRLQVIATHLREHSPLPEPAVEEAAEKQVEGPNGAFRETYPELREIGLADWQIAKRLGMTNQSLLRQITRYKFTPQPEFVTMCAQDTPRKRATHDHHR